MENKKSKYYAYSKTVRVWKVYINRYGWKLFFNWLGCTEIAAKWTITTEQCNRYEKLVVLIVLHIILWKTCDGIPIDIINYRLSNFSRRRYYLSRPPLQLAITRALCSVRQNSVINDILFYFSKLFTKRADRTVTKIKRIQSTDQSRPTNVF